MDRRNRGDVLFYALQCAKMDRRAMADGLDRETHDYAEAIKDIESFQRLQVELFGTCNNQLDRALEDSVAVPLSRIREYIAGTWSPESDDDERTKTNAKGCENE